MTAVARDGPDSKRESGGAAPATAGERLSLRRAELLATVADLGRHDPAATANLDFGKRIGDGTSYAVDRLNAAYQARTLYETVKEIDQAMARLEAGNYGSCTLCGRAIPAERLALVPWAARCVACSGARPRPR